MARLSFGVCFAPDPPPSRWVELTRLAEQEGFDYAWLFDSHVLWQEVYPIFTLMAVNTQRIKIGPCVTNPGTRDPTVTASALATLNEISSGRMVLGMGRGDSARRVLGQHPVTVEDLEAACRLIRDLAAGREVTYDGATIRLKWAEGHLLGKTNREQEWGIIRISARGLTGRVFRDPASSTGYMLEDKCLAKEFLEVECRFRPIE